jgi:hypothetical protein
MAKKDSGQRPKSLAEAGLQQFQVEEMPRAALKGAAYNPRVISDTEKGKLKKALKRHGLVAPITWNKRTGNIVGGHQRITIMDSLMGSSDYSLSVAVIDVDEVREKELNVLLNNGAAQGSWDMEGLAKLFGDDRVSLEGSGFDVTDLYDLFGDGILEDRENDLAEFAKRVSEMSGTYDSVTKRNKAKLDGEYFCVLVFPDRASMLQVMDHVGASSYGRYQNGMLYAEKMGLEISEDGEDDAEDQ